MSNLGFSFYPKDWWTSDTFYVLQPFERYIYLEVLFMMYTNDGWIVNNKLNIERRLFTTIRDEVWLKITDLMVKDGDQLTHKSINKRLRKTLANRENGKKGGRPKKELNSEDFSDVEKPKKPKKETQKNPPLEIKYKVNNIIFFNKNININSLVSNFEPRKRFYFLIAYKFWRIWKDYAPPTNCIEKAEVEVWADEVRKILEIDKVPELRLIGIAVYFEKSIKGEIGFDDFWVKTIKTVGSLRKKDKQGVFYFEKIADKVNKKIKEDDNLYTIIENSLNILKEKCNNTPKI